ncbi:cysteine proteinase 7-like [Eucalyptus grandis]|uniref:cysteine proteinase 7-like n=1 Tax=Eucalyptus grandis TaxID=71139 RepID=UPI00192EFD67|nr:cysteine proteinase 7-like [Eucalyptus grandis]
MAVSLRWMSLDPVDVRKPSAEAELDRGSLGGDVGSGAGLGWRRGVADCWAATASSSGAGVRRIGRHSASVTSEQEATALGRLAENSSSASSYWAVVQLQAEQRGSVQVAATGGQGGAAKVSGAGLRRAARWRGEVRSGRLRSSGVGLGSSRSRVQRRGSGRRSG